LIKAYTDEVIEIPWLFWNASDTKMNISLNFTDSRQISVFKEKDKLQLQALKKTKIRSDWTSVNESMPVEDFLTPEDALAMRTNVIQFNIGKSFTFKKIIPK
jgi:hypothetical protein